MTNLDSIRPHILAIALTLPPRLEQVIMALPPGHPDHDYARLVEGAITCQVRQDVPILRMIYRIAPLEELMEVWVGSSDPGCASRRVLEWNRALEDLGAPLGDTEPPEGPSYVEWG